MKPFVRRGPSLGWGLLLLGACLLAAPLLADRAVAPLTFVYGLEGPGALALIEELGLNALHLDLPAAAVLDLEPTRARIRAAQARGLKVVVGLPTTEPLGGRLNPRDSQYCGAVTELITHCVRELGREPGVTAWSTGHGLEGRLNYSDADFREFLQRGYPSLEALNAAWGSAFRTWLQVTREQARQVDASQVHRVGRASIDLAEYERTTFRDVMQLWLQAIRAVDPERPVLTGRVTLYRSFSAIPEGYDVVCVATPPDVLDSDLYGHNPHGLDMARRAGKFQVLAVLRPPAPGSAAYREDRLRDWVNLASLHGACGVALESWEMLQPAYDLERHYERGRRLVEAIRLTAHLRWGLPVRPTAAVLWEPYASGAEVAGQPTYGYVRGFLPGEPAELLWGLRLGSRFGTVDCLALEDVLDADLQQYGVAFLPAALRLPPRESQALAEYVQKGGAVVADLGLGAYDSGSWTRLPAPWEAVCGIGQMGNLEDRAGNPRVGTAVPFLPSLRVGQEAQGTFRAGRRSATAPATARRTFAVAGPTAEVLPSAGAIAFAPLAVRVGSDKQAVFRGLQVNRYGLGLAVFASHSLWPYWPLADGLSTALHGDLLARRAAYELDQPGVWQAGIHFAAAEDEVVVANLGRDPTRANLWAYGAASRVFAGAVSRVSATTMPGLTPGTVLLTLLLPGRGQAAAQRVPLQARPQVGDAALLVEEYSPAQVRILVAGAEATVQVRRGTELTLEASRPTALQLLLANGRYPVAPGSRHLVTRITRGGQETQVLLTAGDDGVLDLSDTFRRDTLIVRPAPAP